MNELKPNSNPRAYETNSRGHVWKKTEWDHEETDVFAFCEGDMHNGPRCVKCNYGFCHHCEVLPVMDCSIGD